MKSKIILLLTIMLPGLLTSCEDKEYPAGLPEYDNHYYIAYVPYNNSKVTVTKNQAALVKFPVQFNSAFVRTYDAVGQYGLVTDGQANPAVLGKDFDIVDKNGNPVQPVDGKYSFKFAQAKKTTDTIYVKLLNNPASGTRTVEIQLMENVTPEYTVDNMSNAFRRPLEIK